MYVPQVNFRTLNFASPKLQKAASSCCIGRCTASYFNNYLVAWYFAKKIKDNENMLLHGKYQRYLTCKWSENEWKPSEQKWIKLSKIVKKRIHIQYGFNTWRLNSITFPIKPANNDNDIVFCPKRIGVG